MREYPLTEKQIEICNYLLSINHDTVDRNNLKEYDEKDISYSERFLKDEKLITGAFPIRLTALGLKYSKTGIVKYFKDQRRDKFLRSPIVLTILFFIPVLISIFGTIINYNHSNKIENKTIDKNQINEYIDSVVQTRINELNKLTIDKPMIDSLKHIE